MKITVIKGVNVFKSLGNFIDKYFISIWLIEIAVGILIFIYLIKIWGV